MPNSLSKYNYSLSSPSYVSNILHEWKCTVYFNSCGIPVKTLLYENDICRQYGPHCFIRTNITWTVTTQQVCELPISSLSHCRVWMASKIPEPGNGGLSGAKWNQPLWTWYITSHVLRIFRALYPNFLVLESYDMFKKSKVHLVGWIANEGVIQIAPVIRIIISRHWWSMKKG